MCAWCPVMDWAIPSRVYSQTLFRGNALDPLQPYPWNSNCWRWLNECIHVNHGNFKPGPWGDLSLRSCCGSSCNCSYFIRTEKYTGFRWHHSVPRKWTIFFFRSWTVVQWWAGEKKKKKPIKPDLFLIFPISHTALNLVSCFWSATNCFLLVVTSNCAAHMNSFKGPVGDCGNWQRVTDTADFFCLFQGFWWKIILIKTIKDVIRRCFVYCDWNPTKLKYTRVCFNAINVLKNWNCTFW